MVRNRRYDKRCEAGQGTVEALFIVLILAVLFFGAVELAQAVLLKHSLDVATEKAARLLSVNPADYGTAENIIRTEIDGNLLGGGFGDDVVIYLLDGNTMTPITPAQLDAQSFGYRFWVGAELDWSRHVTFLPAQTVKLSCVHHGIVERYP